MPLPHDASLILALLAGGPYRVGVTGQMTDPLFLDFQLALAGRYALERELGRGGSGIVYLAHEVHLERLVAIKLLPPAKAADTAVRDRFLREARLAAALSHPNIIPIHTVGEVAGFVFYVMAFVDGETLADRVRTRGPAGSAESARILREVAWALAHAHAQGIVHRDVKPDNILLETGSGRALVTDFGIAAATRDAAADRISGTPEFMSPEQALGAATDGRSDLYSLGVTGFYVLTGRLPFEGATATEVIARHVTEPPPLVESAGVPVARKLARVIDRCLAKTPGLRPQSADALADELGLSLEQRREFPAALRNFVKRDARLSGGGTLLFAPLLLAASVGVAAAFGATAGYAAFACGVILGPLAYFTGAARKLLQLGYAHPDLSPAFRAETEEGIEERTTVHGRSRPLMERVSLVATLTSFGSLLGAFIGVDVYGTWPFRDLNLETFAAGASFLALISLATYLSFVDRRRDIDAAFWRRVWTGAVGRLVFASARRLGGTPRVPSAVTHRATELALGMASESLYESLPREVRASLRRLPAVVRRLQQDAQRIRELHDQLAAAVQRAQPSGLDADRQLAIDRDRASAKLSQAIAALETIRLGLLRLHAGAEALPGLTTDVGIAADVSRDIDRLIAARQEVERDLAFPRRIAASPA